MKRKTLWSTGAGVLAMAALLAWAFAPRPIEVEVAQAGIGPFETTIDEDGRTRLRERFVVSAPLNGRLRRLDLREGDTVQAGAPVATMMPSLSPLLDDRSQRELGARISTAEAGVLRAATRIAAAKVALEQTRVTMQRTAQLAQQGFVSPNKIDSDRLATDMAQTELDSAVAGERIARLELEQARAAMVAVRSPGGSAPFVLRAPITGQVLRLHQTSEAALTMGAPIMDIGDTGQMEIVAELLSTDALLARPGSVVRIERWGGPVTLAGRVRLVEPAAFTKVSALGVEEQRVNVMITITSAPAQWTALGDAYRVGVRIVTRSEDAVLRVPVSAVFPLPASSGKTSPGYAVFLLHEGRARLRPVTVQDRNGRDAWIQDGLQVGDQVIVYPPASVTDGARVAIRKM